MEQKRYSFSQLYIWGSLRNQSWSLAIQGLTLANSFLVLKILSLYQFGLYQLVLAALAIADSFVSSVFDPIVSNDISRALVEKRPGAARRLYFEFLGAKMALALAVGLIFFLSADLVAGFYGKNIGGFVRIASLLVILNAARSTMNLFFGAVRSFSAFGAPAVQEAVRLAGLAAVWFLGMRGLRDILLVSVFSSLGVLVYLFFRLAPEYRRVFAGVGRHPDWMLAPLFREYGRWVFLRFGFSKAAKQMDAWFVRVFLSTEAVGIYGIMVNLLAMIQAFFPLKMLSTLLPWELSDMRRLRYLYRRGTKYMVWLGAAAAVAAFIAIPKFVEVFLPAYTPAMPFFRLLLITLPLYGVYKFQKSLLTVLREQKILAMRIVTEAVITAGVLIATLPFIGLYGIVVEFLATYGGRVLLYSFYLRRHYPHLSLLPFQFIVFDRDDRALFRRAAREFLRPQAWFKPIRVGP